MAPRTATAHKTVICLGDSHTRGFLGASWLNLLRLQFPHLRFINAGNDGEPSERILSRLPGLLKSHPNPAAVLIFSGSNDCIAQETEDLQQYYKWWFWLSQRCSEQVALDNLEQMLQMVQEKAPSAKVMVINLPIMVEDPQHTANMRAHKYSRAVCDLVAQRYPQVSMVDLQTACRQHMDQHSRSWQEAMQASKQQQQQQQNAGSTSNSQWKLNLYSAIKNMAWSKGRNAIRRHSWNQISSSQGLVLLTDQIHMNDTAAGILAGLVQPLLQSV